MAREGHISHEGEPHVHSHLMSLRQNNKVTSDWTPCPQSPVNCVPGSCDTATQLLHWNVKEARLRSHLSSSGTLYLIRLHTPIIPSGELGAHSVALKSLPEIAQTAFCLNTDMTWPAKSRGNCVTRHHTDVDTRSTFKGRGTITQSLP